MDRPSGNPENNWPTWAPAKTAMVFLGYNSACHDIGEDSIAAEQSQVTHKGVMFLITGPFPETTSKFDTCLYRKPMQVKKVPEKYAV